MVLDVHTSGFDVRRIEAIRAALLEDGPKPGANGFGDFASAPSGSPQRAIFNMLARLFWEGPIVGLYRETFGTEPLLLVTYCGIRQHISGGKETSVPWHLDANFVGFPGNFLTCWVPLVEVGLRAPGLEFCAPKERGNRDELRRRWQELPLDAKGRKVVADAEIPALLGPETERFSLTLSPGGFAAFDQYVLHRTQVMAAPCEDRLAIEFRVCDRDDPTPALPNDIRRGVAAMWRDRDNGGLTIGPLSTIAKPAGLS